MEPIEKEVPTYTVRLYMAGDINSAKYILRMKCWHVGLCVTIEPTTFIYTGGEEAGFVIGFVNYPRFPKTPSEIYERAHSMAHSLMPVLNQSTALLVATDKTVWIKIKPPGAKE